MRVLPGTHVNIIACQGGLTDVKLGDEVMGLVPALLYSGASSTVSTLWSIADGDGANFAQHFFDSFLRQCTPQIGKSMTRRPSTSDASNDVADVVDTEPLRVVDLAKALRAAVVKMDRGETQPLYRWAGFVLHGFWRFPLSEKDRERLFEQ